MAQPFVYKTSVIQEQIGPITLFIEQITDVESAIDAMFQELEARGCGELLEELCPYFGSLWPSGKLLAQWIFDLGQGSFRGKRVLEIGCGLALPSFVASSLGASVVASDLHPDVPSFLARNLSRNPGFAIDFRPVDWRESPADLSGCYDWVLASDVLYEKYQAAALVDFLKHQLPTSGQAIVIDPDRGYWERFVVLARHAGFEVDIQHRSAVESEKRFHILQLRKNGHIQGSV